MFNSVVRNLFILFLIHFLFGGLSNNSIAQEYLSDTVNIKSINSSVKAIVFAYPFVFGPYGYGVSTGFEIKVCKKHFATLGGNYHVNAHLDSDLGPTHYYKAYLGHRKYFYEKNTSNPVFWLETNFEYNYEISGWEPNDRCDFAFQYGISLTPGIRFFLSYKKSMFIDFGLGTSVKRRFYKNYYFNRDLKTLESGIRPLIHLGYNF